MGSVLEVTIQRRVDGSWPVVVEHHRPGTLLTVRSEGRLELASEPMEANRRSYGTTLGQALFRDAVRDAFVRARNESPDGVRVLVFVESEELKSWRWEWLCGPVDGDVWDFLSLDQRVLFSLYLPSLTDRAYPPIGRHDLRALVVIANPTDPKYSRLASFDVKENVSRLESVFGDRLPATILARVPEAAGVPTLDEVVTRLTAGSDEGPYTVLHVVCHGWVNPEKETILYLEQPSADPSSGRGLAQPVTGSDLIERLRRIGRLPYLIFLSTCESSAPEAEQRFGGLAQRLVRELGVPAVIGMTERVTIATAHALADGFYRRLLAQTRVGEVDRALVQAYAGLATRPDVNVPALYSRLGAQPLFSLALDRQLMPAETRTGLQELDELLVDRAPVLRARLAEKGQKLEPLLGTDPDALAAPARQEREKTLTEINELCQEAVEINFNALAQGEQPPAYDSRQPFRGLSPFRAEDREFFFGREAVVEKLRQKLNEDNFLPVLGPSGSGKSSLVLAGLVPKLKEQVAGLQVMDDLTPGSAPMDQLKIRQAKLSAGPVLYVVDQFEELFTLCKDEKQRQDFIEELLRLADSNRVVLTMRADFWGECASYPALKMRMQARQELIAPMTTSELRGAMEQQAAKVGLRFEADLSNTMLDEVAGEPGAMPLLQHALLELWKRRHGRWLRAEEYRTIGGVKKAIAETADQVYNQLGQEDRQLLKPTPPADRPTPTQERMRDIFVRLTQIDENVPRAEGRRDTRRRVSVSDLIPADTKPEETKALLKRLADAALVVTSRNEVTGQDEVEVAHEALIRNWGKLRLWLDEDLAALRIRDSISDAAKEWQKDQSDSSRKHYLDACIEDRKHSEFVSARSVVSAAYELALKATDFSDPTDTVNGLSLAITSFATYPNVPAYRVLWERQAYPRPSAVIDIEKPVLGEYAASSDGRFVAVGAEKAVRYWSIDHASSAKTEDVGGEVLAVAFDPISRWLVVLTQHTLVWMDLESGAKLQSPLDLRCKAILEDPPRGPEVDPGSLFRSATLIVTAAGVVIRQTSKGVIAWRRSANQKRLSVITCVKGAKHCCACPKGDHLAVFGHTTVTWHSPSGEQIRRKARVRGSISLACSGALMYESADSTLRVLDLKSGTSLFQSDLPTVEGTYAVLPQIVQNRFVIINREGFEVFHWKTGQRRAFKCEIPMPHDSSSSCRDESHVVIRAEPMKVLVYDIEKNLVTTVLSDEGPFATTLRLSSDGARLAAMKNAEVLVLSTADGRQLCSFAIETADRLNFAFELSLNFDESGEWITHLSTIGGRLRVDRREIPKAFNLKSDAGYLMDLSAGFPAPGYRINYATVCPGGDCVAMLISRAKMGGTLVIHNPWVGSTNEYHAIGTLSAVVWTPDHELLCSFGNGHVVSIGREHSTKLFDTGRDRVVFRCVTAEYLPVVAVVSVDRDLRIWSDVFDKTSKKKLCSICVGDYRGPKVTQLDEVVQDVDLSPRAKYLAICAADGEHRVYDVASANNVFEFKGEGIYRTCFSRDETRCVVLGEDSVVHVLDIRTGRRTKRFKVGDSNSERLKFFSSDKASALVRVNDDFSVLMTTLPGDPFIRYWLLSEGRQVGQIRHGDLFSSRICSNDPASAVVVLGTSAELFGKPSKLTINAFRSGWPSDLS